MKRLKVFVTEGLFRPCWYAPATWPRERRRYWEIEIYGNGPEMTRYYYGVTQAIREQDIALMACEYAALQDDGETEDYEVEEHVWR